MPMLRATDRPRLRGSRTIRPLRPSAVARRTRKSNESSVEPSSTTTTSASPPSWSLRASSRSPSNGRVLNAGTTTETVTMGHWRGSSATSTRSLLAAASCPSRNTRTRRDQNVVRRVAVSVRRPEPIQLLLVLECVHRSPEAMVLVRPQLPGIGESGQDIPLQVLASPEIECAPIEHEVAAIDPQVAQHRLFFESGDQAVRFNAQQTILGAEVGGRQGRRSFVTLVIAHQLAEVDVCQSVAVSGVEYGLEKVRQALTPLCRVSIYTRVDATNIPIIVVLLEVVSNALVQITTRQNEVVETLRGIDAHHLLDDRDAVDLHHSFGHDLRVGVGTGALAAAQNDNLHASGGSSELLRKLN